MKIIAEDNNRPFLMCTQCGGPIDHSGLIEGDSCPVFGCNGTLRAYEPRGAVIANKLDCNGFEIIKFHIAIETDKNPETEIIFKDHYSLPKVALPNGFHILKTGAPQFRPNSPIHIFKTYNTTKSRKDLALEIANDVAALYNWLDPLLY